MDAVVRKAIGLYLMTLGLAHFCSSQCVDTRHLNFQSKENSSIGAEHAFKILPNADIWLCMELCYKYTLCRSVDCDRDKTTCRLNVRSATDNPSLLVTKQRNIHVDREHFPEIVAGDCLHHSCNNVSICIRGNCVPILQDKTCGPLPIVSHAEGIPPSGPFPVGHTHNYTSCSVGYMPSGDPYTSCQDDGKWSDVTFECKVKNCGPPPVVNNTVGIYQRGPFPVGYTHNYESCSVGYVASGEPSTTCQDQNEWSEVDYQCAAIADQCLPNGNYRADRWCYYFGDIKMNAAAAQDFCSARKMQLVHIETQLEWQTLQPLLVGSYWTAGYATVLNETNNITAFYWGPRNDTDVITFFSWAPGQPDDPSIESDITVNTTGWYDEREDVEIYALCEDDGGIS